MKRSFLKQPFHEVWESPKNYGEQRRHRRDRCRKSEQKVYLRQAPHVKNNALRTMSATTQCLQHLPCLAAASSPDRGLRQALDPGRMRHTRRASCREQTRFFSTRTPVVCSGWAYVEEARRGTRRFTPRCWFRGEYALRSISTTALL